jgi:hypothetical protein
MINRQNGGERNRAAKQRRLEHGARESRQIRSDQLARRRIAVHSSTAKSLARSPKNMANTAFPVAWFQFQQLHLGKLVHTRGAYATRAR